MKETWNKITSALSKFFKDVYSKVLTPIGHFFQFIWNWCYTNVFTPVGHFFQFIWNWCYTIVFTPVGHFFNKGWNWFTNTKTGAAIRKFFSWSYSHEAVRATTSSIICILIGLFIGFIVMMIRDPSSCFEGLGVIFVSGAKNPSNFANVLVEMTPMILAGISISFAFKLGLFNIGVTGQLTMGAFLSILTGLAGADWYWCLLVGMLGGAAVGSISGFLKAKFNVNEVLSGIMLNWIVYYLTGLIGSNLPDTWIDKNNNTKLTIMPKTGRLPSLAGPGIFEDVTWGLIIAAVIAIIIWFILRYTKFGFELKLCGSNKYVAKYAGINQNGKIILSLLISGAIAGICGYMVYGAATPTQFTYGALDGVMISDGFNGISIALIGQTNPIGCIFSSFFLSYINQAQTRIVNVSSSYSKYYMELVKAVIIYGASLSSFIGYLLKRRNERKKDDVDLKFRSLFKKKGDEVNAEGRSK